MAMPSAMACHPEELRDIMNKILSVIGYKPAGTKLACMSGRREGKHRDRTLLLALTLLSTVTYESQKSSIEVDEPPVESASKDKMAVEDSSVQ